MVIQFNNESYKLLKTVDVIQLANHIKFNDQAQSVELDEEPVFLLDYFDNKYESTPLKVLLDCIADEVAVSGLTSNQEEVLPRGRELYALYDDIYYNYVEE